MEKRKSSTIWKPISIGSTAAVVFVMGSSLLDEEEAPTHDEVVEASTPGDEESFQQAFAEARSQKGRHSSFEWRGRQYSTSTREEWDNMTESQHQEIAAQVVEPSPADASEVVEVAEEVGVSEAVDVADPLDVSVMDDEAAPSDVEVMEESPDESMVVTVNTLDEDDFGDDDVRMIGMDNIVGEDAHAAFADGDQDVYVVNLDDVDISGDDEEIVSEDAIDVDVDLTIQQQIDISTQVDYEEPQPEDDGLMGESLDSYYT